MGNMQEEEAKRLAQAREQVGGIAKIVEEERQQREFMEETKLRELEGIDERLDSRLQQAVVVQHQIANPPQQARVDSEKRLRQYIDDKFHALMSDIKNEAYERDKAIEKTSKVLDSDIGRLNDNIKMAQAEREEADNTLLNGLLEEVSKLGELVGNESQNRLDSDKDVCEMLQSTVNQVKVKLFWILKKNSSLLSYYIIPCCY